MVNTKHRISHDNSNDGNGVAADIVDAVGDGAFRPVNNGGHGRGRDSHNFTNYSSDGDSVGDDTALDEWVWRGVMGVCDGDGGA